MAEIPSLPERQLVSERLSSHSREGVRGSGQGGGGLGVLHLRCLAPETSDSTEERGEDRGVDP